MVGFRIPHHLNAVRNLAKHTGGLRRRTRRRLPHPEWPFVLLMGLLMLVAFIAVLSIR